jgi:adenylate cyclase class IV
MIEVEKKFILSEEEKNRLLDGAEFLSKKTITDVYYDTENFALTSCDKWLRTREGKFEFKVAVHSGARKSLTQYDEIEDDKEIKQALGLNKEGDLKDSLLENGYLPFCVCKTKREKYKKEGFNIDLDEAEFNNFSYNIAEIELMVNDVLKIDEASEKITTFAIKNGLRIGPTRGKILEFLKRESPVHFETLVKCGVVDGD